MTKHIAVFSLPSIPSSPLPFSSDDRIVPFGTDPVVVDVIVRWLETVVSAAPGIPLADTVGMWLVSTTACIATTLGFESALRVIFVVVFVAEGPLYFLNCDTFWAYIPVPWDDAVAAASPLPLNTIPLDMPLPVLGF